MTKPWKDLLLCAALIVVLLTLLLPRASFAGALTYGRDKLKGTTTTQGDFTTPRPNLADAQDLAVQAHDKVVAAQGAGEWDKTGHAKRAENLLAEAIKELKIAAEAPLAR